MLTRLEACHLVTLSPLLSSPLLSSLSLLLSLSLKVSLALAHPLSLYFFLSLSLLCSFLSSLFLLPCLLSLRLGSSEGSQHIKEARAAAALEQASFSQIAFVGKKGVGVEDGLVVEEEVVG